ncbi:uncharacterized protein LOC124278380 [Haliotis rubra]|uniref:uncharacterized protein LOC124278380 n=1 Tax=Haliotis rubra TaxID=36100 RepID=UPI001EE523C9|nr:uncharacterized protein LOC124278380 [Haliotis rubra]
MLTRKLPYCYEYVDSFDKLEETKLPSRDEFYSSLSEDTISKEDYDFAHDIWMTFKISSVREFMELYVAVDTLILTDVFEAFRDMCLSYYRLDPCQYFTLPGMAMDACLLMTGVKLDLMTEPDQYNFVSNAIRGGVASINHRYAQANNKHMHDFDPSKPESYLLYYDINNLYGAAMSCPLPLGQFEWVDETEIDNIDWLKLDPEGDVGYIVECDLEYPRHLHVMHQSLPLAPTKESIPFEEFSPYHKDLLAELGMLGKKNEKKPATGTKLFSTLKDKQNYVSYFGTLQQYLQLGLKLKKVHRVLKFSQSKWMESYIDFNTKKRKEATDNFSKDLFKLLSNAVYGKQLQNVRNYKQIELITTEERLRKYTAKPNFKSVNIFSENLVVVSMERVSVTLNQNVSVGFTILEHAKRLLYDFHYNVMLKEYSSNHVRVCMTDTDSLFYQIWSPVGGSLRDPEDFLLAKCHLFDTSNYPPGHDLHSMDRHKAIGLMKNEVGSKQIREFVGLRAKNYSFIFDKTPSEKVEKCTAKGVKEAFKKKHLRHQMFKDCLFKRKQSFGSYHQIRSLHNTLYTDKVTKLTLTPQDDKRYLLPNGLESRPYGFNPL